jgi:hypothetical protein
MMSLSELQDYTKWIGRTAREVYLSVVQVGGWQNVFPGHLPRWASRVRQYFNVTPLTLELLDEADSDYHLARAQKALPASRRAKARRDKEQSRGMGMSHAVGGVSTKPGTMIKRPDPRDAIDGVFDIALTMFALSGDVYDDADGKAVWYQTVPGGAIYHFGETIRNPELRAAQATLAGQEKAPVFKLLCPDGTGGSREVCIKNPLVRPRVRVSVTGVATAEVVGEETVGPVGEIVPVLDRVVRDSVAQGSYNYAETMEKGYPAHVRLDVRTDPMEAGYYVEPDDLFRLQFIPLNDRRFPPNDPQGRPLAAQNRPAP